MSAELTHFIDDPKFSLAVLINPKLYHRGVVGANVQVCQQPQVRGVSVDRCKSMGHPLQAEVFVIPSALALMISLSCAETFLPVSRIQAVPLYLCITLNTVFLLGFEEHGPGAEICTP